MTIGIEKLSKDSFALILEDGRHEISRPELEQLYRHLGATLFPGRMAQRDQQFRELLTRLRSANDTGIQALLRTAAHDDILVLLHASEQDEELRGKLYGNMSENSVKFYVEDILFQFRDGIPEPVFDDATRRLIETVEGLVGNGTLKFET